MGKLTHRTAPGCTYFVTTKTWQSRELFRVTENAEILVQCILRYRDGGAYLLHEFVVMPNQRYIHHNPVVAHLVQEPAEWLYSSASGRFALHPEPEPLSSGAKARSLVANMSELKLRPPEKSPQQSVRLHPSGAGGGE